MAVITLEETPEEEQAFTSLSDDARQLAQFFLKMQYHKTRVFQKDSRLARRSARTIDELLETLFVRDWTANESSAFIFSAANWFAAYDIPYIEMTQEDQS